MKTQFARGRLISLTTGYIFSQAISCAAALRIPDLLAEGPRSAADLAQQTGCSAAYLDRVLGALCTIGVFDKVAEGYALTDLSQLLRKEAPGSVWPLAVIHGEEMYRAFGKLLDNVRTGTAGWEIASGTTIWEHFAENPRRGELFDSVMRMNHEDDVAQMVTSYDFAGIQRPVDVGGGDGSLLREILARHLNMQGILFDCGEVIARARTSPVWASIMPRCEFVAGDFFAKVPRGGDLYILRHVLHDWNDEQCACLLSRCREAISLGGRLLVIEAHDVEITPATAWLDLGVMVIGGEERRLAEYENLLDAAGFSIVARIAATDRVSIIDARPS